MTCDALQLHTMTCTTYIQWHAYVGMCSTTRCMPLVHRAVLNVTGDSSWACWPWACCSCWRRGCIKLVCIPSALYTKCLICVIVLCIPSVHLSSSSVYQVLSMCPCALSSCFVCQVCMVCWACSVCCSLPIWVPEGGGGWRGWLSFCNGPKSLVPSP